MTTPNPHFTYTYHDDSVLHWALGHHWPLQECIRQSRNNWEWRCECQIDAIPEGDYYVVIATNLITRKEWTTTYLASKRDPENLQVLNLCSKIERMLRDPRFHPCYNFNLAPGSFNDKI